MSLAMYWVVGLGLLYSATMAAIAISRGRLAPARTVPWIIAIVVLSLDVVIHLAMSIGVLVAEPSQGGWIVVGTLAIAGILVGAIWQPRFAGWAYVLSALLMPLILIIVAAASPEGATALVPLQVMLGFYSSRAIIVGLLLVFSGSRRRTADASSSHDTDSANLPIEPMPNRG